MTNRFCVNLSTGPENPDKATVAFVVANAALASGKETLVFLTVESVRFGFDGGASGIHADGFAPLAELITTFGAGGGVILVCTPCAKVRGIDGDPLVAGAVLGGGAGLVEFMTAGEQPAASVSY
jgi:predicted peroxiredoxin